jgi:hypothetical protein
MIDWAVSPSHRFHVTGTLRGRPKNWALRSAAAVLTGAVAVLSGSVRSSAQATVDSENRYPNVGAIMVWRVDDFGRPDELRGFASGTLIRPQVIVTAGHFTAPVKALGEIPPTIGIFASFNATRHVKHLGEPVMTLGRQPVICV